MPQPWNYTFDSAQGLIDISWEQRVPPIQLDDIDKDPLYNQYPYQEADVYDDNEEEMEVDDRLPGGAMDACMATPIGTQWPYHRPPVSYTTFTQQALGSHQSIHTDTDAGMEFDTLKVTARATPPQGLAKEVSAPDLVNQLTKIMAGAAAEVIDGLTQPPLVTHATDAMVQERFMQRRTTAALHPSAGQTPSATGRITVWNRLAY